MKTRATATETRIEELRARLERLDAERTAVSAELHRLTDPGAEPVSPPAAHAAHADPIPESGHKDWHIFAGPAKQLTKKAKSDHGGAAS